MFHKIRQEQKPELSVCRALACPTSLPLTCVALPSSCSASCSSSFPLLIFIILHLCLFHLPIPLLFCYLRLLILPFFFFFLLHLHLFIFRRTIILLLSLLFIILYLLYPLVSTFIILPHVSPLPLQSLIFSPFFLSSFYVNNYLSCVCASSSNSASASRPSSSSPFYIYLFHPHILFFIFLSHSFPVPSSSSCYFHCCSLRRSSISSCFPLFLIHISLLHRRPPRSHPHSPASFSSCAPLFSNPTFILLHLGLFAPLHPTPITISSELNHVILRMSDCILFICIRKNLDCKAR